MGVRKITPPRICEGCGASYERKKKEMPSAFERRRFCSIACATAPKPFDWAKFDALIDTSESCWIWRGQRNDKGYGIVWKDGRPQGAHRVSYERESGVPLGTLGALHKCDTPACVRPSHIFPGTQRDNSLDMWSKGRAKINRGEAAGGAILLESDVVKIVDDQRPSHIIAAEYGVSSSTIKAARTGRNWKHLGLGKPKFRFVPTTAERAAIRAADKRDIGRLAEVYGVPPQSICDIRRKTRVH